MGDVGEIALEAFVADLAEEYFSLLALLVLLYPAHVFLDVQVLLSADEETLVAVALRYLGLLLLFALGFVLYCELLAAPLVQLGLDCRLRLVTFGHLLYILLNMVWLKHKSRVFIARCFEVSLRWC